MKKIIALLLTLALSCGMLFGCAPAAEAGPSLDDAVEYLTSSYRTDEGKETVADYKLMAQVPIEGVKFEITWTVDLDSIEITLGDDGLYNVNLPTKNEAKVQYILTATIKDADGKTVTKQFTRVLGIYDDGAAVTEPVEGEAYKLFFVQGNLGKTLYCINEASNNKFIKTDVDPKVGADFYVEKVDGGYKFYTDVNGTKMYLHAHTTTSEDGKISKYLSFEAESDAVYYYKTEVKTWMVKIDNIEYGIGTYNTYDTMSLSEGSYFTAEKVGTSQFVMTLMAKAAAEELAPTEGPADPTELTAITDFTAIAEKLEDKTGTVEKYLVKGTISEIKDDVYGNMYIQDEEGNQLYIYGVYSKDGSTRYDAMETKPQVGDTVTLMGIAKNYNGPQMDSGWLQELVAGNGSTEEPDPSNPADAEPSTPNNQDPTTKPTTEPTTKPTTGGSTSNPTTGLSTSKNYYISSKNAAGDIFFDGTIKSGRINGATAKTGAATVKLEKAATAGEYYIYFTAGTTKTYIAGVLNESSKTASFTFKTTKDDSCIWIIDESAKTITSKALETRGIATQNTSDYTNFSTYATSNFGDSNYTAAWFVEAASAQAGPADTGASSGGSSSGGSSSGGSSSGTTAVIPTGLKNGDKIVLKVKDAYLTANDSTYTSSSGSVKEQLLPSTSKSEAVVLTVKISSDNVVTFVTNDNKYLYSDGNSIKFAGAEDEYTKFVFEQATGGYYIRCNTAQAYSKAQYLEYYESKSVYSVYSMGSDTTIYTFVIEAA